MSDTPTPAVLSYESRPAGRVQQEDVPSVVFDMLDQGADLYDIVIRTGSIENVLESAKQWVMARYPIPPRTGETCCVCRRPTQGRFVFRLRLSAALEAELSGQWVYDLPACSAGLAVCDRCAPRVRRRTNLTHHWHRPVAIIATVWASSLGSVLVSCALAPESMWPLTGFAGAMIGGMTVVAGLATAFVFIGWSRFIPRSVRRSLLSRFAVESADVIDLRDGREAGVLVIPESPR